MDKKTQTLSHKNINKTVGIITIQNIKNYGACLQSFALWYYINSLEYNCEIINLLTPAHKGYKKSKNFHTYEKKIGFIKRCYRNLRALANKIKENYICFSEKNLLNDLTVKSSSLLFIRMRMLYIRILPNTTFILQEVIKFGIQH